MLRGLTWLLMPRATIRVAAPSRSARPAFTDNPWQPVPQGSPFLVQFARRCMHRFPLQR
jgi:hypothetical protein